MIKKYRELLRLLSAYWRLYGGFSAFYRSPYVHISVFATACSYGLWSSSAWVELPIQVVPNLLGFSLGVLTIFIGFGSEAFRDLISGVKPGEAGVSPYLESTATFVHFILMQCLALFLALILNAASHTPIPAPALSFFPRIDELNERIAPMAWAIGYWIFMYAVLLSLSAVLSLFRVARWFDVWRTKQLKSEHDNQINEKKKRNKDSAEALRSRLQRAKLLYRTKVR